MRLVTSVYRDMYASTTSCEPHSDVVRQGEQFYDLLRSRPINGANASGIRIHEQFFETDLLRSAQSPEGLVNCGWSALANGRLKCV